MIEKLYTVTDLGPGDGGKGSVIQSLCARLRPAIVIKEGGAQGSHGVNVAGESFRFSQWGCGTFNAVPTYLSRRMVIAPSMLLREAESLRHMGIYDAFKVLTADRDCLCATPYHMYISQINEMLRGDEPRGTVGSGIGVAYREYALAKSESPATLKELIFAADLTNEKQLAKKLGLARERARELARKVEVDDLSESDQRHFWNLCQAIDDSSVYGEIVGEFLEVGRRLRLDPLERVLKRSRGKIAVVERSHGVLTDAMHGLKPHVSALRTLPCFSEEMFREADFKGEIVNIGVHRAYEYRHGAGPMPSAQGDFLRDMPRDYNRWQGSARYGYLDTVLLRYALEVAQPTHFDGIALTCMDHVLDQGNWPICRAYKLGKNEYVSLNELERANLVKTLNKVDIITDAYSLDEEYAKDRAELVERCSDILSNYTQVPLCLLSFGGTERDKYYLPRRTL